VPVGDTLQGNQISALSVILLDSGSNGDSGAGIFKQSMGARNRVGVELSYQPARLHSLGELVPLNRFLGSLEVKKFGLRRGKCRKKRCCYVTVDFATAASQNGLSIYKLSLHRKPK
jgi:hypothetical protein